jgi:hypothetical protein
MTKLLQLRQGTCQLSSALKLSSTAIALWPVMLCHNANYRSEASIQQPSDLRMVSVFDDIVPTFLPTFKKTFTGIIEAVRQQRVPKDTLTPAS